MRKVEAGDCGRGEVIVAIAQKTLNQAFYLAEDGILLRRSATRLLACEMSLLRKRARCPRVIKARLRTKIDAGTDFL